MLCTSETPVYFKTFFFFFRIHLHAVKVYETIDEIISKKFNKSFHNLLKQKILKIILKLHNKHDSSEVEDELLQDNFEDSSKNEEKAVLETLKGLSQCKKHFSKYLFLFTFLIF